MGELITEPITGAEVRLTPLQVTDAASMVAVLADPELYRFTGGSAPDVDELTARYRAQTRGGPVDGAEQWVNWIVRQETEPIGFVQATLTPEDGGRRADIAWVIGTPWQGRGHAGTAAALMRDWLAARGVGRFTASIHPEHGASQGVAVRLGLVRTAEVTDEGEQVWAMTCVQAGQPVATS